jgi:hypothetical protein
LLIVIRIARQQRLKRNRNIHVMHMTMLRKGLIPAFHGGTMLLNYSNSFVDDDVRQPLYATYFCSDCFV